MARKPDSDESDEEYRASEDDDSDDSDESYSLDGDLSEKNLAYSAESRRVSRSRNILRTSRRKVNGQLKARKRRKVVFTDNDNGEHTISDEEREQIREAMVYCANLRENLRSSSCGKPKPNTHEQRKYHILKGKGKLPADKEHEIGKQVCGICLSEEGKRTVRGVLNSCQHYFCFSCIMEWSKVESRCPVCKQRFATITKAANLRLGLRTVVIPIPECDQIYEPSEEEIRAYLDAYDSVICSKCHDGGDESLMLLCDACDSPAHTFCVGHGWEVPEGNWYCERCRPTVVETINSQCPTSNENRPNLSSPFARGFDLNQLYVPETPLMQPSLLNSSRMCDLVDTSSGTLASSSGIRLFGSWHHPDPLNEQLQTSGLASIDASLQDQHGRLGMRTGSDSRLGYAQPPQCTNESSMTADACPSPYACTEDIGSSRTSKGDLRTPSQPHM